MNFFEAQDSARRSSSLLILLFTLAVTALLVLSNIIVFEFLYFIQYSELAFSLSQLDLVFDGDLSVVICAAIIGFICLGSLISWCNSPRVVQSLRNILAALSCRAAVLMPYIKKY